MVEDPPRASGTLPCTIPQVTEQIPMSFKVSGLFDPNFDLVNVWPDLMNENLFDKEKCRFRGKDGYYEAIEPALRLASRIILLHNSLRAIHHEIRALWLRPGTRLSYCITRYAIELDKACCPPHMKTCMKGGMNRRRLRWNLSWIGT